jgi:hypothetical protein
VEGSRVGEWEKAVGMMRRGECADSQTAQLRRLSKACDYRSYDLERSSLGSSIALTTSLPSCLPIRSPPTFDLCSYPSSVGCAFTTSPSSSSSPLFTSMAIIRYQARRRLQPQPLMVTVRPSTRRPHNTSPSCDIVPVLDAHVKVRRTTQIGPNFCEGI